MYFDKFDSLKNEMVQIMDKTGKIINPDLMPKIKDKDVVEAYKLMCLSRKQDEFQNKIQRQGKMLSFLSSTGQEASEVAYAMQLIKGKDWFSPAYRNNAAWLAAGIPMRNIMLYWCGNELGTKTPEGINVLPVNIPIATQYSHATGLAFAEKYKGTDAVVITTTGDGGSSEGEFYEAMNFGKLHDVPAIYIVENNQYAISTPRKKATKAINFAVKAIGVGIRNVIVDGNDFFAVYGAVQEAIALARKGEGPSFIECNTYRLGAHSSADDPKVYRDEEQYQDALTKDPLIRMKAYLIDKKLWSEQDQEKLDKEQEEFIKNEFAWVEQNNVVELEDIFKYTYAEMPEFLQEQYEEAKAYFAAHPSKGGHH
ncbi:pyruvate dehydrogenase [Spiroplasma mirum ATCC 29335]|uniref:Pyruvate dehydrogenase E1 component subunit alpha n=1 Tax=Spiroplasma mirum ATCC 29335 TaxID=838561 RepID=W0GQF9_9MOLU|nr:MULTISPECIES: pyruvate dehydrogenase (acetyl-transferring) E1 component subunit alpha [Spiroplasma]AHF60776.1 pyruvate dehydrogenase E1 component alpha subunit [Spiroplasma mirum ATCC 29335]AHI57736.1 pyruvate dehydrogenase [Spiroplasma mirum ATCC 29335]AKM52892.1 pyruvate dehydrogenase E1 component subunit alpha [Spiroplasma atrichopogonis]